MDLSQLQKGHNLKPTKTVVTDVLGQRHVEGTNEFLGSTAGFVVDTKPDPGLFEVIPGIFIGSQDAAGNYDGVEVVNDRTGAHARFKGMKELGITHVVNAFSKERPHDAHGITYLNVIALDVPETPLGSMTKLSNPFIHNALVENGKVLVHCNAGVSRSASIVAAFLIQHEGLNYNDALKAIRAVREAAKPNDGFTSALEKLVVKEVLRSPK